MSLQQRISEHVSEVFMNTDHFAIQCRRLVRGDDGDVRLITGVPGEDHAATDDMIGRGYTHVRTFDFAESSTLEEKDSLVIESIRYEVAHVTDPDLGMKTATLGRYQPEVKGGKYVRRGGS